MEAWSREPTGRSGTAPAASNARSSSRHQHGSHGRLPSFAGLHCAPGSGRAATTRSPHKRKRFPGRRCATILLLGPWLSACALKTARGRDRAIPPPHLSRTLRQSSAASGSPPAAATAAGRASRRPPQARRDDFSGYPTHYGQMHSRECATPRRQERRPQIVSTVRDSGDGPGPFAIRSWEIHHSRGRAFRGFVALQQAPSHHRERSSMWWAFRPPRAVRSTTLPRSIS